MSIILVSFQAEPSFPCPAWCFGETEFDIIYSWLVLFNMLLFFIFFVPGRRIFLTQDGELLAEGKLFLSN